MSSLLLVGGHLKDTQLFEGGKGYLCDRALLLELDTEHNVSTRILEYVSPAHIYPSDVPEILFRSATVKSGQIYLCTGTEVFCYALSSMSLSFYLSLPSFNDLHHVVPTSDGTLLLANTGLDMVMEITPDGTVLREWDVMGGADTWTRFSRDTDYRIVSTKPHRSHPNYVFTIDDDIWVTRFHQRDALCLTRADARIIVDVERPHDGHTYGDWVIFSTVDGHLVIAHKKTLKIEEIIDLAAIDNPAHNQLGWCRGILPVSETHFWVGFTRIRSTKFKEHLLWIRHGFRQVETPTHLALYDISNRRCLQEINLEEYGMGTVFSIHPQPLNNATNNRDNPAVLRASVDVYERTIV
jgi:hypothetical protein